MKKGESFVTLAGVRAEQVTPDHRRLRFYRPVPPGYAITIDSVDDKHVYFRMGGLPYRLPICWMIEHTGEVGVGV